MGRTGNRHGFQMARELLLAILALCALATALPANITLYIGRPPSSELALLFRDLIPWWENKTGRSITRVTITDRDGAAAIEAMLSHPPDGEGDGGGIAMATFDLPHYYFYSSHLGASFARSAITPIYIHSYNPVVMCSVKYSTLAELLGSAAAAPTDRPLTVSGSMLWSAHGIGHINLQRFDKRAKKLVYVPAETSDAALNEMLSGNVSAAYVWARNLMNSPSNVKVLGVSSEYPVADLPGSPLFKDVGIPDTESAVYRGIVVNSEMPEEKKLAVAAWMDEVSRDRRVIAQLRSSGFQPSFIPYPKTKATIRSHSEYLDRVMNPEEAYLWLIVGLPLLVVTISVVIIVNVAVGLRSKATRQALVHKKLEDQVKEVMKLTSPISHALELLSRIMANLCNEDRAIMKSAMELLVSGGSIELEGGISEEGMGFLQQLSALPRKKRSPRILPAASSSFSLNSQPRKAPQSQHSPVVPRNHNGERAWSTDNVAPIMALGMSLTDWGYDPEAFAIKTSNHPLQAAIVFCFGRHGIDIAPTSTVAEWSALVEGLYLDNPFHNALHAADVVQATSFFLTQPDISRRLTRDQILAVLIAAAIHDAGHIGRTNAFLIETAHPLAVLYNDTSVLENYHLATAFKLTTDNPNISIFANLGRRQTKAIRKWVIELVVATDLAFHYALLDKLKTKISVGSFKPGDNEEDTLLMCKVILKCADLSNPARPFDIAMAWAKRLSEEFYQQGDEEKQLGMQVSNFMDRDKQELPKSQMVFLNAIALPLWRAWSEFSGCSDIMDILSSNLRSWTQLSEPEAPPSPADKQ